MLFFDIGYPIFNITLIIYQNKNHKATPSMSTTIVGREKQLSTLRNIIDNAINFGVIIVHGPPSSGKSLVVNHILKEKNINNVYISCRTIATVKL